METRPTNVAPELADGERHQSDPARRRRLRWRSRRGLLENDLVVTRFLDRHEETLTDAEVAGLDALMQLVDNRLLDLILDRVELDDADVPPGASVADMQRVLALLRAA